MSAHAAEQVAKGVAMFPIWGATAYSLSHASHWGLAAGMITCAFIATCVVWGHPGKEAGNDGEGTGD